MNKTSIQLFALLTLLFVSGCGESFLDLKPNQSQRIPATIADYQALLDNTASMNQFSCHALGIIGSDEYYMSDARYDAFQTGTDYNFMKRAYSWEAQVYEGGEINTDWSRAYLRILQCNIVLDGLKKIHPDGLQLESFNLAKGSALFFRAVAYYSLAQLYCAPYEALSAETKAGLPLRIEADVTLKVGRSTIAQTYQLIRDDLHQGLDLLEGEPAVIYRPSKTAAHALLSRLYMQMGDYAEAAEHASGALALKNTLNDFNVMNLTARYIFTSNGADNPELIFYSSADNATTTIVVNLNMSTELLGSYTANDLRKTAYFHINTDGRILFKGGYTGSPGQFTGLAVDEVLLNRAECNARLGKTAEALHDVNTLAAHRYEKASFVPFSAPSPAEVLQLVIAERRKELVFRGIRWEELRRLNKERVFAKTISRTIKGQLSPLPPNDARYTWPIPLDAIASGGYEQNER
jgi:tetratricopeptide (TPR) repeat protein